MAITAVPAHTDGTVLDPSAKSSVSSVACPELTRVTSCIVSCGGTAICHVAVSTHRLDHGFGRTAGGRTPPRAPRVASGTRGEGFTQGHVAHELDWSLCKVNRIEKGDVTVSRTDLLALLEFFGVDDDEQVDELVRAARSSRQRGWWDEPRYREHVTPAMLQLFQYETEATAIRFFQPTLVPGPLQTRAYAQRSWISGRTTCPTPIARVAARGAAAARGALPRREDPPDICFIFDESVLRRAGRRVEGDGRAAPRPARA